MIKSIINKISDKMEITIKAFINLNEALEQLRTQNGRAYGYYLARSKRTGRGKQYMNVVDKLFLR